MDYAKLKAISVVGRVCAAFNGGTSKAGKKYGRLPIQDLKSGKIYVLMAFDALVGVLEAMKVNERISVRGRKDAEEDTIFINTIAHETAPIAHIANNGKSPERQKYMQEYWKKHDFVPVIITDDDGKKERIWLHKEQCVQLDEFEWKRKIDYLMDHPNMGPKNVREAMIGAMKGTTALSKEGGQKVRDLIDKLVLDNMAFSFF